MTTIYSIPVLRITMVRDPNPINVRRPTAAVDAIRAMCCANPSVETMVVLYLDGNCNIRGTRTVAMGGIGSLVVTIREIYQGACDAGAWGVILGHNHPSGSPKPSKQDIELTHHVLAGGKVLGIPLIDHIVVTDCGKSHSMRDHNEGGLSNV